MDESSSGVGFKFGWDEAGIRMYLSIGTVRSLFPSFEFNEPDDIELAARAKRGVGTRPSYVVQMMQSTGSVFVSGRIQETIITPAKIVRIFFVHHT